MTTKPDLRLLEVLTPAILATASHWCIVGAGIADTRPTSLLTIPINENPGMDADPPLLESEGERYWPKQGWRCYPCTFDDETGIIIPEPWPMLKGEREIKEWRGMAPSEDCLATELDGMWDLENDAGYTVSPNGKPIKGRPGMRPAPRKGDKGIVWVWEKVQ